MGKKNYGNRPASKGVKLANIIAKDLEKYLSPSNASSLRKVPTIELCISGGELADDGMEIVCNALEVVLSNHTNGPLLHLDSLDVSNNSLTVAVLPRLISVIRWARLDINDLDLSNNRISVGSSADARSWANFLSNIHGFICLKRVNLAGNDMSNPMALEVFLRVYSRYETNWEAQVPSTSPGSSMQERLDPITAVTSKLHNLFSHHKDESAETIHSVRHRSILMTEGNWAATNLWRGIRAIPYVVFQNTGMTDVGALFLSYALERHALPCYLRPSIKATHLTKKLDEYSQQANCYGLVYLPNENITKDAQRLLELSETQRPGSAATEDSRSVDVAEYAQREEIRSSPASLRKKNVRLSDDRSGRRVSISSGTPNNTMAKLPKMSDIEHLRAKIQRNTIKELGVHSVQLWCTALKFLRVSRILACSTPLREPSRDPGLNGKANTPPLSIIHDDGSRGRYMMAVRKLVANDNISASALKRWKTTTQSYQRDSNSFKQLPEDVLIRLIRFATDTCGVLSDRQQLQVFRYAKDKMNVQEELAILGKEESVQVWTVLDRIGCLTYEFQEDIV